MRKIYGLLATLFLGAGANAWGEEVTLTLDYPAELDGCVMNLFNRTSGEFLGVDSNHVFTMPADRTFAVEKGSQVRVNFNEGYTLTKFMLGTEDVTADYVTNDFGHHIIVSVEEDVTLSISGEAIKYAEVEFTAYILNADGVCLGLETYSSIHNPVKDITGEEGEAISEEITIPSFTVGDNEMGDGSKTVPSVVMNSENTLKFTVKVSERRPMIYISPVSGYYIQSVWDSNLDHPVNYLDGNEEDQRTFYVVALPLLRDQQFVVDMPGEEIVTFRPFEYFSRNWDNPSISYAVGMGERTYDYNSMYDNPFTLFPMQQYTGFTVTLNGRQAGITETDYGTYVIDFTQAYVSDKYPVPTLKIVSASTGVEEIETVSENEAVKGIFNLQGVRVSTDWNSLPAGIYIREGKKVVKH